MVRNIGVEQVWQTFGNQIRDRIMCKQNPKFFVMFFLPLCISYFENEVMSLRKRQIQQIQAIVCIVISLFSIN